jgi:diadenosine tetraphosphate (Ap4A) HIT family hydrolase
VGRQRRFVARADALYIRRDQQQHLSKHHGRASKVEAFNLLSANGAAAQKSAIHLHIHFLPRYRNNGIDA